MNRKPTKNTPGPNADEKAFQSWLKEQPCCVTGRGGVDVHHMYGSAFKNNKILIGHWACIPLCPDLHRGMDGIHTIGKARWCDMWGPQSALWELVILDYSAETGETPPNEVYDAIMDWGR